MSSTLQLPFPSILRGGVLFCSVIVHNKVMNILQKIFTDHYEEIKYTMHTRPVVMDNIDRMINCGDPSFGGAMYACPDCGHLKFVPFRCKSRFCPTCGVKYAQERSTSMSFKLIKCTHRHCVFTIDEQLRPFFLKDRSLLNCLFRAVRSVMLRLFYKLNKSRNFVPGFICVLHTFGRPLEWNPHIHCLISQGAFSDDGFWRTVRYFNFTYLRKSFQTALLNEMELIIGPSFKTVKSAVYKKCINGFYVYAKPNLSNTNTVIKYISRYLGRPAIALKRIDSYDGHYVTFHYNKHEDNSFVKKTIPVLDFIKLLIQHIPDWNFKMTRYYGLYARNRTLDSSLIKSINKSKHKLFRSFTKWRYNILLSFGYNPLCCPVCGSNMLLAEIRYNHHHVSLEQLFEKAKLKALCRSS